MESDWIKITEPGMDSNSIETNAMNVESDSIEAINKLWNWIRKSHGYENGFDWGKWSEYGIGFDRDQWTRYVIWLDRDQWTRHVIEYDWDN